MVDIYPFKALRPSVKKGATDISGFICPPYDVISEVERKALLKKSPVNVVRVELAEGEGDMRYANAAGALETWRENEVIQEDRNPSYYLLETTYRISDPFAPKTKLKRYGVMAALRLETPGKGAVRPHEKTLPKAKEERLKLLREVKTHVSSIFGLFFDKKKEWPRLIASVIRQKPIAKGRENKNLEHRLWKIDNPAFHKKVQKLLKDKQLYIADGHHRYEVSWAYKGERLSTPDADGKNGGWNYVMTYICPIEEPGLLMLPTHRLVQSSKSFDEWKSHLETFFDLKPVKSMTEIVKVLSEKKKERVLGWVHQKGKFLMTVKPNFSIQRCLPHRVEALRNLDVVLLHDLLMEESAGKQYTKDKDLIYTRDMKEIEAMTASNPSWSAFILGSSGVASLAKVAEAGEVMPPKTTYFYPKVPTGFTMMSVSQKIGQ